MQWLRAPPREVTQAIGHGFDSARQQSVQLSCPRLWGRQWETYLTQFISQRPLDYLVYHHHHHPPLDNAQPSGEAPLIVPNGTETGVKR